MCPRWGGIRARNTVMWFWSADTLFWQLSIDHNMDAYYQVKHRLQAPILAWKFDISHWLPCGADGCGRCTVMQLAEFLSFLRYGTLLVCTKNTRGALPSYTHHDEYLSLETYTSRIIVSSFDHRVCFFYWISSGSEAICHFHARAIARRRKAWFPLRICRILFAAKHSWTALCMSRPLFAGSYLQVTCRALSQWKERKICFKW